MVRLPPTPHGFYWGGAPALPTQPHLSYRPAKNSTLTFLERLFKPIPDQTPDVRRHTEHLCGKRSFDHSASVALKSQCVRQAAQKTQLSRTYALSSRPDQAKRDFQLITPLISIWSPHRLVLFSVRGLYSDEGGYYCRPS